MFTQPHGACRHSHWCWGASSLSVLLAGLSAVLVFSALPCLAQAQSDQTSSTFPFHHFSGASAIVSHLAIDVAAGPPTDTDPVPIPGGFAPGAHIFAPGPTSLGFQGLDVEPNGITNFSGFSALAYLSGTATDSNGNTYNVGSDMRLYRGEYISSDGTHHRGIFVFI
jgi:hypothetical protein